MSVKHELWKEVHDNGVEEYAFFRASYRSDRQLGSNAELVWTVEADSYAGAMTKYHEFMDWDEYNVMSPKDWEPYSD